MYIIITQYILQHSGFPERKASPSSLIGGSASLLQAWEGKETHETSQTEKQASMGDLQQSPGTG